MAEQQGPVTDAQLKAKQAEGDAAKVAWDTLRGELHALVVRAARERTRAEGGKASIADALGVSRQAVDSYICVGKSKRRRRRSA